MFMASVERPIERSLLGDKKLSEPSVGIAEEVNLCR
jgi:hypothetical protein